MAATRSGLALLLVAIALPAALPGRAAAQEMDCDGLWRERNRIYSLHGYCFQTERAIRVFGRGCFPPYGAMPPADHAYVARLQRMERQQGCAF